MISTMLFVHAATPLHAGVGQGAGAIDLPIARERGTGLPYLPGSSLKGTLRALAEPNEAVRLFGPDTARADSHAGSVQLADARLLFLPVRSLRGVFAYATSPLLLRRYARDRTDAGATGAPDLPTAGPPDDGSCVVAGDSVLAHGGRLYLEDLTLRTGTLDAADAAAFGALGTVLGIPDLPGRVCILSDDVMSFLAETATEVAARVRLDENTKTVANRALWYEEALPTETVLAGLVLARSIGGVIEGQDAMRGLRRLIGGSPTVQLGGKATVGRGVCRIRMPGGST